jgi:hypothetical protein
VSILNLAGISGTFMIGCRPIPKDCPLEQAQEGIIDMAAQERSPPTSALPDDPSFVSALTDLSLDELRFLRSCDKRWFELSPVKASAIIRAARNLIFDLIHDRDESVAPAVRGNNPV